MEEETQTVIKGSNAIAKALGRSIPTIIKMKHTHNLPMYLMGGIWEMEIVDFEEWKEYQKAGKFYDKDKVTPLSDTTNMTKEEKKARKEEINEKLIALGEDPLTYNNGLAKFEDKLEASLA